MKMNLLINLTMTGIVACLLSSCADHKKAENDIPMEPVKVELKYEQGMYRLYLNDKPFYLKGAGLEFGNMESLARHGGNSFRTWRVDNGVNSGKQVLDEAYKYGLKVCMGLEVGRERHGFDYDDEAAVKAQFDSIRKDVLELKDHPALLMWGIGNELNLRYTNPKVWDAVNEIAAMIHDIDPNHPTTTMLAGAGKEEIGQIGLRCPELDLLSFQIYGAIDRLPKYIEESGYRGAYIVSEWGATGHWEVPRTEWDRPIEQHSHEKAKAYLERYRKYIEADSSRCIGSFVFLWGQKQERTPTWYGAFLENGESTETVEVMQYVWTGQWPENRAPVMRSLLLDDRTAYDNIYLESGRSYRTVAEVEERDGDPLAYRWEILREVDRSKQSDGGDFEPRPETVFSLSGQNPGNEITFTAPEAGEYRLFVYASDGKGNAATANIPFMVK